MSILLLPTSSALSEAKAKAQLKSDKNVVRTTNVDEENEYESEKNDMVALPHCNHLFYVVDDVDSMGNRLSSKTRRCPSQCIILT